MKTSTLDNFDKQVKKLEELTSNKKQNGKKFGKIKKQIIKEFNNLPKKENK